jgi:hypothetical protein
MKNRLKCKKVVHASISWGVIMQGIIFGQFLDTLPDRVKTGLDIPFNRIGTIKPRNVNEIES